MRPRSARSRRSLPCGTCRRCSRIRRARADEGGALAPVLTDLCRRSKAHWGYETELLERWAGDLAITAEDIDRDAVLVAELVDTDGTPPPRLAGFARISRGSGSTSTILLRPSSATCGSSLTTSARAWVARCSRPRARSPGRCLPTSCSSSPTPTPRASTCAWAPGASARRRPRWSTAGDCPCCCSTCADRRPARRAHLGMTMPSRPSSGWG